MKLERSRLWKFVLPALLFCPFLMACGGQEKEHAEEHGEHREEEAHAEDPGSEVRLTQEQLKNAGISVQKAGPGKINETFQLTAVVSENQDTSVHINPRVNGLINEIFKGLGDRVREGEALCEVNSVEFGNAVADYLQAKSLFEAAQETYQKEKALFEKRIKIQEKVLDGAIAISRRIFEREEQLKDQGITTLRPYLDAQKEWQLAEFAKDRELTDLRAERDARLLSLDVAQRQAEISFRAARDRLLILEFNPEEIEKLKEGHEGNLGHYVIRSPLNGIIDKRHISLKEFVDQETTLFEIHDLSKVWILASVYEKDLTSVRLGQRAIVSLDAFPGVAVEGKVAFIQYGIEAATRAAAVRIEVENKTLENWKEEFPLRPGMFGTVELVVDSREADIVLPETAVVHEGEEDFVFIREDELTYEKRAVKIRGGAHGLVEVLDGVRPGEEVVVGGGFTLKSLARSGELGEGHAH